MFAQISAESPPPQFSSPPIFIFCIRLPPPAWLCCCAPGFALLEGFQMVRLAEVSKLTPRQLILTYLDTPRGSQRKRRHLGSGGQEQERMSGRGRLMKDCITGKPVIYFTSHPQTVSSSSFSSPPPSLPLFPSSLSKLPALRCRLKRQHIHLAITQESCRKNNGAKIVT